MTSVAAKNRTVAVRAALFGLAMLALAFASVPLYRVFCQVTGFGGTTMKADAAPGAVAGQVGGERFYLRPTRRQRNASVWAVIAFSVGRRSMLLAP